MPMSLRNGFYAGLLLALGIGLYLFQLWQPERQVRLHALHLVHAVERNDWKKVEQFIDPHYRDRWGHDRELLLARLRLVLAYARNLHLEIVAPATSATREEGEWSARITVEADRNEVSEMIKERINSLDAPFQLHWRRIGQAWEWKLVRVDNVALEIEPGTLP